MGRGMAANLAGRGVQVCIYDIDPAATRAALGRSGVTAAENLATLGRGCNRVLLSLPDAAAVEAVLFGGDGLASSLRPGAIVVDCGTTHAEVTRRCAARLAEGGIAFLDAPVTGMESRAAAGTLTIMVGGDQSAFETMRPLLEQMGTVVEYMGPSGNGQLTKMANNALYNISVAAMAEMLPLAVRLGLDPDKVRRVVGSGSGQSFGFDYFAPRVLAGVFDQGYPMASAFKDMVALMERANQVHAPMPVASAAMQTYRMALAEGYGAQAKGAMIKVWERVMGIQVRAGAPGVDTGR